MVVHSLRALHRRSPLSDFWLLGVGRWLDIPIGFQPGSRSRLRGFLRTERRTRSRRVYRLRAFLRLGRAPRRVQRVVEGLRVSPAYTPRSSSARSVTLTP